jgi:hypothetical protein
MLTVDEVYRQPKETLPIPENYRVVDFAPPKTKQLFFSCLSHAVLTATATFGPLSPRIIVEEIEPCEMCGELEPVMMTEIKKSDRAKNYALMMLCAACIEKNKELVKK